MSISKITTHVADALARLIEQYKSKPKIEGFMRAMVNQFQELEDVGDTLFLQRMLDDSVGEQLDNFGTIVALEREGFDDDFYRILLAVKIGQNISRGEPERIISVLKILTQATLVHYQNLGNGNIGLATDGTITPGLETFTFENMERVVMAGVRINFLACFDPDEPFSFDGTGPVGLGFSSLAAPTSGGKFAFLHRRAIPFAFAGSDVSALGFGTLADPLVGGTMVGL